jgi:plastocyanin
MRSTGIRALALATLLLAGCAGPRAVGPHIRPPRPPAARGVTLRGQYAATDGVAAANAVIWLVPNPAPPIKPSAASRRRAVVLQGNHAFAPRVLVVEPGTSVEFQNTDSLYHSVFSVSPTKVFDVGRYAPGEKRSVTFDRVGTVNLFCALDSQMAGWVVVVPTRRYAQPDAAGSFALAGLRPGRYTLHFWDPVHGERKRPVDVTGSGDVKLTVGG